MERADRREFQRLKLARPILGMVGTSNALILDIGMAGAFVEHYGTFTPGDRFRLTFRWQGEDVEFECEVRRSTVVREPAGDGKSQMSHTGVHFLHPVGDSAGRLRDLIATFVGRILAAQKANAAGDRRDAAGAKVLETVGGARRSRSRGFICYRLKGDKWWRAATESPRQPSDGFTVGAFEDDDEVETLCRAYQESDEEGRRLIRMVAELSVSALL